jgi:hypothetical protein
MRLDMSSERERPDSEGSATAESEGADQESQKVPESASGKGDTPLGDTDQHSDAAGPTGLEGEEANR